MITCGCDGHAATLQQKQFLAAELDESLPKIVTDTFNALLFFAVKVKAQTLTYFSAMVNM